jgi:hypothetical protein
MRFSNARLNFPNRPPYPNCCWVKIQVWAIEQLGQRQQGVF